ncbi:MAG: septum formation initiator family protein [Acidobacteria bacterium]|nr:septum formation initiator family protein [Acidobacteriota bacterium]HMU32235.1 septum formation initiator family protein [Pyrinomonadaceae bacterium]
MKGRRNTAKERNEKTKRQRPFWISFLVVLTLAGMLFVSITYRSFSAVTAEVRENEQLNSMIQNLTDENLQLQDEIHSLKTDPKVIEREAKRLGIAVKDLGAKTQVPVPAK